MPPHNLLVLLEVLAVLAYHQGPVLPVCSLDDHGVAVEPHRLDAERIEEIPHELGDVGVKLDYFNLSFEELLEPPQCRATAAYRPARLVLLHDEDERRGAVHDEVAHSRARDLLEEEA